MKRQWTKGEICEKECAARKRLHQKNEVPAYFRIGLEEKEVRNGTRCAAQRSRWHRQWEETKDSPTFIDAPSAVLLHEMVLDKLKEGTAESQKDTADSKKDTADSKKDTADSKKDTADSKKDTAGVVRIEKMKMISAALEIIENQMRKEGRCLCGGSLRVVQGGFLGCTRYRYKSEADKDEVCNNKVVRTK